MGDPGPWPVGVNKALLAGSHVLFFSAAVSVACSELPKASGLGLDPTEKSPSFSECIFALALGDYGGASPGTVPGTQPISLSRHVYESCVIGEL